MLICMTLYNEQFYQFLQSLWGVIMCIIELTRENPNGVTYSTMNFGTALIADGLDKIDPDFIDQLVNIGLFDPEL